MIGDGETWSSIRNWDAERVKAAVMRCVLSRLPVSLIGRWRIVTSAKEVLFSSVSVCVSGC